MLTVGRSKFCPVYEFSGSIFGKSAYFRVTSVAGHVFTTDFPPQYRDWQKTDPLKLFEVAPVKKESDPKVVLLLTQLLNISVEPNGTTSPS